MKVMKIRRKLEIKETELLVKSHRMHRELSKLQETCKHQIQVIVPDGKKICLCCRKELDNVQYIEDLNAPGPMVIDMVNQYGILQDYWADSNLKIFWKLEALYHSCTRHAKKKFKNDDIYIGNKMLDFMDILRLRAEALAEEEAATEA